MPGLLLPVMPRQWRLPIEPGENYQSTCVLFASSPHEQGLYLKGVF